MPKTYPKIPTIQAKMKKKNTAPRIEIIILSVFE